MYSRGYVESKPIANNNTDGTDNNNNNNNL
jgi:hypothetical protein